MQDAADDNRDNNVKARDGTVDAAREEEEEYFSKSSERMVAKGTQ